MLDQCVITRKIAVVTGVYAPRHLGELTQMRWTSTSSTRLRGRPEPYQSDRGTAALPGRPTATRPDHLRARITAATNKVESYNHFVSWYRFGNHGVIADNDPDEQEKIIKCGTLLADCVIFHNALDMMTVIRDLIVERRIVELANERCGKCQGF